MLFEAPNTGEGALSSRESAPAWLLRDCFSIYADICSILFSADSGCFLIGGLDAKLPGKAIIYMWRAFW